MPLSLSLGPGVQVGRTPPHLSHLGGPAHVLPWWRVVAGKAERVKIMVNTAVAAMLAETCS